MICSELKASVEPAIQDKNSYKCARKLQKIRSQYILQKKLILLNFENLFTMFLKIKNIC